MSGKEVRLVLDTNTIISGLLWRGNEFRLLTKVERGEALMFVSKEIIDEVHRVLH
jgi:putative PIN family toxin of toxin-antitoxin system